ncbi:protein-disulfide reductase DsbD family protein [Halobacteriovorax sp. GFR7]|uniref:protein-disulfide reductase DsbD family protein n=1 Tax=unclassified Halobacteriovorax TaxID=2639665 RepID=UPI003D9956F2
MYKILLALAITLFAYADKEDYSDLLKAQVTTIEKDSNKYLTINLRNKDGWHTYWQNPGDSGLATEVEFRQGGDKIVLDLVEWPTPHKFIEKGDIQTFGHKGDYTYFYYLGNSFDNAKNFEVHLKYLICHDICIPQERIIKGDFNDGIYKSNDNQFRVANSEMEKRFNNLPTLRETPTYLNLQLTKYEGGLALVYNITGENQKLSPGQNVLTPYTTSPISFKREALYKDTKGNHYGLYQLDWDGEYLEPEYPLPTDGRFNEPLAFKFVFNDPVNGETYRVDFDINSFGTNEESFKTFYSRLTKVNNDKPIQDTKIVSNEEGSSSLPYFLLMAFIGGLILNIMPCVLPVISLKLFGLIKHSNESRSKVLKHNLFYSLGVLATFAALAFTVVGLKASGEQIGWGFQLQSPMFVAIMVFVIFTMALNLFGLFEFKTPGGTKLGNVEVRNTFYGDFISGVLATILSTPCSAPFLGTALTFAFSESSTNIVMIFLAIGFGLSAPFILTGIFPALIRFLPRPGMWMDHVKKILGLTLILTVVWLLDVYSALVGSPVAMMYINSALVFTFFLFYMRKHMTKKVVTTLLIIMPVLYLGYSAITTPLNTGGNGNSLIEDKKREGLNWTKWTEDEMNMRIDQRKLTFIDFTARWCITCKVNEKLVINTDSFKDMVAENQVDLLLGDWTRKDEAIGKWLESQGMVGVPAYFVINKNGELIKLGETITLGKVKKALGVN